MRTVSSVVSVLLLGALILSACAQEKWEYVSIGGDFTYAMRWNETYAAYIEEDLNVDVTLTDVSFHSRKALSDMLKQLQTDQEFRSLVENAEVVTISVPTESYLGGAQGRYMSGMCGGDDGQDCLRESVQNIKDDWTGIIDEIAALRAGAPVLLRVVIIGDWFYDWEFSDPMTPEEKETLIKYYREVNDFIEQDAARRGIVTVRAFPEPYFYEQYPPVEYLTPRAVHFYEQGSQVIADELRKAGYEFVALK